MLVKITTNWWPGSSLHPVFQDLSEQDSTHWDETQTSLVASAHGETLFHPSNGQGEVQLSLSCKRAGHKAHAGQPSHRVGAGWSHGVDRLSAHRSAAAPACLWDRSQISASLLAWDCSIARAGSCSSTSSQSLLSVRDLRGSKVCR